MDIISFFKEKGMKWPFKSKTPPSTSFPIGPYRLDMQISELTGLREFSKIEYRTITRHFKGERIYRVPDLDFLSYSWKILLNIVNHKIYIITAYIETKDKDLANGAIMNAFLHCKDLMGEPMKQRSEMFIWKAIDGDVALKTKQVTEGFKITLILTSKAVRNIPPLR